MENQTYPCQIEITDRGWWLLTYPNETKALLLLNTESEQQQLLADCGVTTVTEITTTNFDWYKKAITFVEVPF